MLDLGFKYEEQLRELMMNTWYDEKYKFYYSSTYRNIWENPKNCDGDWNCRQFVSIDSKGKIIGMIGYHVDREANMATGFGAINFSDNKVVFGKDLAQVIDDIFCKFNMRKLEFFVIVGNPIERSYDRMIAQYGGNITGIRHKCVRLIDNQYYV